jgi:hypothetical protein
MSKGSTRRRPQVSQEQIEDNWTRTFKRKLNKTSSPPCDETSAKPDNSRQNITFNPCETNNGQCGCEDSTDERV